MLFYTSKRFEELKKEIKNENNKDDNIEEEVIKENTNEKKELTEEEVLDSNNIDVMVNYAKENRSKVVIDKVRELLETSRETGEKVVQNFLNSFKECEDNNLSYLDFENTDSGKLALNLLEILPEPFKTNAYKKLEDYKEELKYREELLENNKDPQEVWKEITGFDYSTNKFKSLPSFLKFFSNNNSNLEIKKNPLAIEFLIKDIDSYNKLHSNKENNANKNTGGFFSKKNKTDIIAINESKKSSENYINEVYKHETEHAIHKNTNLFSTDKKNISSNGSKLYKNKTFEANKIMLNTAIRKVFYSNLDKAKNEIFAYFKGGRDKEQLAMFLTEKNDVYDFNQDIRNDSNNTIDENEIITNYEKQQLKDIIIFFQSEYERVLNNIIDVIYSKNKSVEFFRNVPINELWKYSNGKYDRTDFLIKEFKF
ncbi:MAG TPA: hypothetical protein PLE28_01615 [bacterium]|nr:hypothetical protein [bacterium]